MTSPATPARGLGRLGRAICRLLLGFYPRDFRREVGADWLEFLADQRREPKYGTRVIGGARFWKDVGFDVVATAFRVWGSGEVLRPGGGLAKARPKNTGSLMDSLGQDVRYAFRALLRSPGFSGVVVLTLALGIGANTAMYSLVHGVILTPLPYPDSERLVSVGHSTVAVDSPDGLVGVNSEMYLHYRELNRTLEDIAIFRGLGAELAGEGDTERTVGMAWATEGLPDILRVQPMLGRWFNAGDVASGAAVVVLGHELWTTQYGEDPSIVGRTIRLNDDAHEVIGVMPAGFSFPYQVQLWTPYEVERRSFRVRMPFDHFRSQGVARLKPDVTPQDAEADLNALIPWVREAFPGDFARFVLDEVGLRPDVQTLKRREVADVERRLWILQGMVAFVLLIACANVANLFLVRGQARQRAVAIRVALGAGRARLLRWYLAESTLLAVTGGALGLAIAHGAVRLFADLAPASFRRWADVGPMPEVGVDANVLLFTLVVSLATSLIFAVTLGLRSPSSLVTPLHEGRRRATMGRFRFRGRHALVVSQVALTLVLLVGAGLMTRSFWYLDRVDLGFDPTDVLPFWVGVPRMDRASVAASHQELLERLAALPGVDAAGAARYPPLNSPGFGEVRNTMVREGAPLEHAELAPSAGVNIASPGYFEALRIPLLAGRAIERSDHEQLTDAVVVSASLAETLWPGEDAIGKRVHLGFPTEAPTWLTVVGVVGDVQPHDLAGGRDASRTIYTPMRTSGRVERNPRRMGFYVRASVPPLTLADAIRGAVRSVYGGASVGISSSLEERVSSAKAPMRVTTLLVGLAALLALGLATIGVYGVSSYVASQMTGEIGIRMALGATARDVSRMMLRQGGSLVFVGLVIGLAGATLLTGVMKALLFEVTPTDWVTYAIVSVLLLSVALVATYLPARRAAHVDPVEALRAE